MYFNNTPHTHTHTHRYCIFYENYSLFFSLRFVSAVYPSVDDDVITSPYNSVLAMHQLTENADCVLPIENQVKYEISNSNHLLFPVLSDVNRKYQELVNVNQSNLATSYNCLKQPLKVVLPICLPSFPIQHITGLQRPSGLKDKFM